MTELDNLPVKAFSAPGDLSSQVLTLENTLDRALKVAEQGYTMARDFRSAVGAPDHEWRKEFDQLQREYHALLEALRSPSSAAPESDLGDLMSEVSGLGQATLHDVEIESRSGGAFIVTVYNAHREKVWRDQGQRVSVLLSGACEFMSGLTSG